MICDDFCYVWQGMQLSTLPQKDINLLKPIEIRSSKTDHALLLLHGFSSSPAVYRYLIPEIKHYDAIICPALPGHGDSLEAFSHSKSSQWLQTAKTICDELTSKYQKVDVLGLSLGGLLTCELSKQYHFNHLFLLAPALKLNFKVSSSLKLARILNFLGFLHLRNAAGNILSNEHSEITYKKLPIPTIIEMLNLVQNYQWIPPTCPIDLFLGQHDEVVASEGVAQLFANNPQVVIHRLKNSAHVLPLDADLKEIIQCINSKTLDRNRSLVSA